MTSLANPFAATILPFEYAAHHFFMIARKARMRSSLDQDQGRISAAGVC
jgi:hypothetical protein